jgi:putative Mn2+ efflux pump MntP
VLGWDIVQWGQLYTILMIGLALGMDAFSIGIGMGMGGIRFLAIAKVSVLIGIFHTLMPLVGIGLGILLSSTMGKITTLLGGLILCFLGANMLWNGFFSGSESPSFDARGAGLFLFAISVSMDALSVGFSFGLFEVNTVLAVIVFGLLGMILTMIGLLLGRRVGSRLGGYGEMLGGTILMVYGIKFLM